MARDFVTVVTGAPRSGTSLLMQLLAAGGVPAVTDGVRAPDASNPRGYLEHTLLRRLGRDPAADALVRASAGRALKVVHALVRALPAGPRYRVLLARRDVDAVVASQDRMLAGAGAEAPALAPGRLAEITRAQLEEAVAALAARTDVALLEVEVAWLVREPVRVCAEIDAFLGGGLDRQAMARAVVPRLFGRTDPAGVGAGGYTAPMSVDAVEALGPVRLEVEHRSPGPAGGPSLRVRRSADGREVLRFDCFAHGAHWHLDPAGRDEITAIGLAHESLEWTLAELRRDLAGYVRRAGVAEALPGAGEIAAALDRVERVLRNPPARLERLSEAVLRQRTGEKWQQYPADVLPLWVADMDYPVAEPIRRRLQRALDVGDTGYPLHPQPTRLPEIFAERAEHRYGWTVEPRRVELLSEVVQGMYVAITQFTEPGDGVIVQTPIYPPFLGAARGLGRTLRENPLRETADGYEVDLEGLREQAAQAKLLLLCNPHNPSGRVLRRAELEAIGKIALEHELVIVSDEIHADLVYRGHRHVPIASLSPEIEARTITLTAGSKAFNIAGLRTGLAIFGSEALQRRFVGFERHLRGGLGGLGILALETAWSHADPWLEEVLAYLEANRDFVASFVASALPGVRHFAPEGTYLAWLDCRALGLAPSPYRFFLDRAKVGLSDGPAFGAPGDGFVRLNFATSRALLTRALDQMSKAVGDGV
jgi:cystathionine beta-lyase